MFNLRRCVLISAYWTPSKNPMPLPSYVENVAKEHDDEFPLKWDNFANEECKIANEK